MHVLKCPGCEGVLERPSISAVCPTCGQIAVVPDLADGAFEKAVEGEEVKAGKQKPKTASEDTSHRPAEEGGRAF